MSKKIKLSQIDFGVNNRDLNLAHVDKLVLSIGKRGLLHRLTVMRVGKRFVIVAGNHRLKALQILEYPYADCDILPEQTSEAEQVEICLDENHVRKDESFEETLDRIDTLSRLHQCTDAEAWQRAGIKPAYGSKLRGIHNKVAPEARSIYHQNRERLGISVLYLIVSKAQDAAQQVAWLTAYLDGKMTREEIASEAAAAKTKRAKPLRIGASVGDATITLTIPANADYATITEILNVVKERLLVHEHQQVPVGQLPLLINATP